MSLSQEALSSGHVVSCTEETQTPPRATQCSVGVQTFTAKRTLTRSSHSQTWDTPHAIQHKPDQNRANNEHLASQVKKVRFNLIIYFVYYPDDPYQ